MRLRAADNWLCGIGAVSASLWAQLPLLSKEGVSRLPFTSTTLDMFVGEGECHVLLLHHLFFFLLFRAKPMACGSSQARG